jgi:hypothetical protein
MKSLKKDIIEYTRKVKQIYLPYLWDKWGVEPEEFSKAFASAKIKGRMVDNLFHLNPPESPDWYEVCDTKYKRGKYIHRNQLVKHFLNNQKKDQHYSVYGHDKNWIENFTRSGSVSCRNTYVAADWIYLELDREEVQKAYDDANFILFNFAYPDITKLFHSGNRSIHIQISTKVFGSPMGLQESVSGFGKLFYNLAHKIAGDARHNNGLVDPWTMNEETIKEEYETLFKTKVPNDIQSIRQSLETIDPNLFNVNSLIRSPFSIHEKTGKKKLPVDIQTQKPTVNPKLILDFDHKFPYLIHWVYECYQPVIRKKTYKTLTDNEDYICEVYSKYLDDFSPSDADSKGFVNGLYSPFYDDSHPSVAINIFNGMYKDFGNPLDTYSLEEFIARVQNITIEQAKEIIKSEQT